MSTDGRFRVGRYDIFGLISAGGMARVHFGRLNADGGFGRVVAVKSIHRGLSADARYTKMLEDEARLLSKIHHPNVIMPIDVITSEAELFLVLDYIPGATLAELVAVSKETSTPLPIEVAVRVISDVLCGLHAAHEVRNADGVRLDVIHRDVSPENILVGIDGVARVFDFGIAKSTDRTQRTTEDGAVKGKLPYMAPEQLGGAQVDRRVDIYAAGVVLWEALAGRRLFRSETPSAVVAEVMIGATKPPSSFRASVPEALDSVVMKALSIVPSERFHSALEMATALEHAAALMRPADLAEWIVVFDKTRIEERAAQCRSIEQEPAERSTAHAVENEESALQGGDARLPNRMSTRTVVAMGAALLLVVLVGVLLVRKEPIEAKALAPSVQPSATPSAEPPPAIASPASTTSAGLPTATESSASSARPARAHESKPQKARPKDGCKVPYEIDSTGHKVYRRECL